MSNCSNCNHEFEFDEQYNSDGSSIESVITCVICLKKLLVSLTKVCEIVRKQTLINSEIF